MQGMQAGDIDIEAALRLVAERAAKGPYTGKRSGRAPMRKKKSPAASAKPAASKAAAASNSLAGQADSSHAAADSAGDAPKPATPQEGSPAPKKRGRPRKSASPASQEGRPAPRKGASADNAAVAAAPAVSAGHAAQGSDSAEVLNANVADGAPSEERQATQGCECMTIGRKWQIPRRLYS